MGRDLRRWEWLVGTNKPYPTRFPLHLGGFVLIHIRIWWVSGLLGNPPLKRFMGHGSMSWAYMYVYGGMGIWLQGCMGVLGLSPFGILNHMGGYNGPGWHMSKVGYIQYGKK